jgi:putative protease
MILAPAGSRQSFLAALAAGADGIYCGLKTFSARMAANNFTMDELASLGDLARQQGTKLYITLNSLLKPGEPQEAALMVNELVGKVGPDAMIIQDLGFIPLIRRAGFAGEIHLSTLANVTFARALSMVQDTLGVDQVVIPRELDIDEIKQLAQSCPRGLGLEMFIHGALCYGVSGRCYWSSFLGGKSGLRGRCVQPCRRIYRQDEERAKFFSCLDFSVDVLAKVLLDIPQIRTWKIEGRKKGPHYVYYTVTAYRMLRDHGRDPQTKRDALSLLERALGRPGTHYNFLPQRPQNPIRTDAQTGSGMMVGRVKGGGKKAYLAPREALLAGDMLRIGYEDESWHGVQRVGKYVPKHGRLYLNAPKGRGPGPEVGTPVFLVDRIEAALKEKIRGYEGPAAGGQGSEGGKDGGRKRKTVSSDGSFRPPSEGSGRPPSIGSRQRKKRRGTRQPSDLTVFRRFVKRRGPGMTGYWLSPETGAAAAGDRSGKIFWWLPPVIWPKEEDAWASLIRRAVGGGARRFVLNAPWQTAFFKEPGTCRLWAGPFCNTANPQALSVLKDLGFSGAVVSPELGEAEVLALPGESPLPLGVVVSGGFPLSISRVLADSIKPETLFASPKGEGAWARRYGNDYWIFPDWKFDLTEKRPALAAAGYELFISMSEPVPRGMGLKKRPGVWNWKVGLQ